MNTIEHNILVDWKKKDVNPVERCFFLKDLLKRENMSMREFAKQNEIPRATLQDWLSLRQYSESKKFSRQLNSTNNHHTIFSLTNRLIFLLGKYDVDDEKTLKELKTLREKLDLIK